MTQDNSVTRVPEEVKMTPAQAAEFAVGYFEVMASDTNWGDMPRTEFQQVVAALRPISENRVVPVSVEELTNLCAEFESSPTVQSDVNLANKAPAIFRRWLSHNTPAPEKESDK